MQFILSFVVIYAIYILVYNLIGKVFSKYGFNELYVSHFMYCELFEAYFQR